MSHDGASHSYADRCKIDSAGKSDKKTLFLDEQRLTRDCIGWALALALPEFTIVPGATARDFSSDEFNPSKIALVIRYVRADIMSLQPQCEQPNQSGIAARSSPFDDFEPETPQVLISEIDVPEDILELFRSGIRGYLPTTLPMNQVAQAIRFVAAGGTFIPPSILSLHRRSNLPQEESNGFAGSGAVANFSPRQGEVIRLLCNGSSNKVIAYELRMSESTVKVHIRHIMKKLNVTNRTLVVLKTQAKWLEGKLNASGMGMSPTRRALTAIASNG